MIIYVFIILFSSLSYWVTFQEKFLLSAVLVWMALLEVAKMSWTPFFHTQVLNDALKDCQNNYRCDVKKNVCYRSCYDRIFRCPRWKECLKDGGKKYFSLSEKHTNRRLILYNWYTLTRINFSNQTIYY